MCSVRGVENLRLNFVEYNTQGKGRGRGTIGKKTDKRNQRNNRGSIVLLEPKEEKILSRKQWSTVLSAEERIY